jgi:hypothetical protein
VQNVRIKGVVISEADNGALPGVNVVEKGTGNGTMTDLDGRFTLNVPNGSRVVFSHIGFKSKEITVDENSPEEPNILLAEDPETPDEVVPVDYGIQKKSVVTAAIGKVSAEDLSASKPSRVEDVLKGKFSGVQITQSSGQPGADSKVRIRGIGTVNNSDPLYIIDGMSVGGGHQLPESVGYSVGRGTERRLPGSHLRHARRQRSYPDHHQKRIHRKSHDQR